MISNWVQKDVLNQPAYKVKTLPFQIKLNQNESPWDWPIEIKSRISESILSSNWNRYPDLISTDLKLKIAKNNHIDENGIVIGKGSNEILQALFTASIRSNDTIVSISPTFAVYKILAEQKGATIIESKLDSNFDVDLPDLLSKSKHAKLTIICNPNSPTGSLIPINIIEKIVKNTSGLIVVDEAYVDFSNVSAIGLLPTYKNLIVTRTFSKAFAMAGFRIGYGLMHNELASEIQKCLLPFNLDMPSIIALNTLLDYSNIVGDRAEMICNERDRIISELNTFPGFKAIQSHSNFFLVSTDKTPEYVFNYCANKGILIRNISSYEDLERYNRITVGTTDENNTLIQILKEMT
ncbi:MAG: histidinol-phosphate transaminase [Candidatus Marinimicrobia bacterium]|jgi:histidinol-phosphate aminotransferase|nr:histidinol-phosphate transaminase [Candidatus Neomarinimicrobiota bacterium]MBT3502617.1 histidinol-phosphate transaminase [Candidatus Neomarinimicrobiota bacterium]MBT3839271.1 histidinol-phosphate transaminase [Candidatus Neomarinimicrobiota bacterium]MBT3999232.1 histidinol-phosphate transaminase [Candidatus Neomarinimicrobiota bacterium]MBT4281932.1 histidinol-phosphate transaminase [Candidatus Neomarinimicrobiota bacterium]